MAGTELPSESMYANKIKVELIFKPEFLNNFIINFDKGEDGKCVQPKRVFK